MQENLKLFVLTNFRLPFLKMNEYYVFIKSFTVSNSTDTVVFDIKAFVLADDVGRVWFVHFFST